MSDCRVRGRPAAIVCMYIPGPLLQEMTMAEPGKGIAGATVVAVIAAIESLASAGLSAWQNQEARNLQKELAEKQQAAQELFQR